MLTMKKAWREMVVWDGESPGGMKSDCLNVDWTIIFVIVDDRTFDWKFEKEKEGRCSEMPNKVTPKEHSFVNSGLD